MFRKKIKLPINWSKIEASAPGKFVLIGDFGDLYERNVIAVAIDKRLKVTIKPHKEEGLLRLHLKDFNDIREWPTHLPVFTMTKLVADYANSLTYNEVMLQCLRPLLNEKYNVRTGDNQKQTSQKSFQSQIHDYNQTSSSGMDLQEKRMDSQSTKQDSHRSLNHSEPPKEMQKRQEENFVYEDIGGSGSSMERETSSQEQADMAVLSFILLYLSLGDSFAASFRPSIEIEVESDIPMCRGLGSSTAYAVAMCTALMKVFRVSAEPTVIMDWTKTIDRFFHGEKSSLHSSVAIHGGYIYFQNGKLKSCGIPPQSPPKLILIDTGIKRRDPKLVNSVIIEKLALKLDTVNTLLNSVNELTSQAWRRMNDPDYDTRMLDNPLAVAQESLDLLGMGHSRISEVASLARRSHLTVKQSQAGQTVFLLYDLEDYDNVESFCELLKNSGFTWISPSVSFDGFRLKATYLTDQESFPKLLLQQQ